MYDKTNIMQIESRERKNVNRSNVFDILRALELLSVWTLQTHKKGKLLFELPQRVPHIFRST